MDYEIFSSNNSILRSSAIHPKIATADLISRFEGEGITSAFLYSIEIIFTISHLYFCKFQNHFPFLNIENYFYNWFLEAHSFENLMLTQKHKGVSNLQTLRHFVAKTIG